jgi:hypothetical protein
MRLYPLCVATFLVAKQSLLRTDIQGNFTNNFDNVCVAVRICKVVMGRL